MAMWLVLGSLAALLLACDEVYQFFPPRDYYRPLHVSAIDLRRGTSTSFAVAHKYNGKYALSLDFDVRPKEVRVSTPLEATYHCTDSNGRNYESGTLVGPYSRYMGGQVGAGGLTLFWYRVPDFAPRSTPLTCQFTILVGDPELEALFGPAKLVVKKLSDL